MRRPLRVLAILLTFAAGRRALAQTVSVPEITFTDPAGFYRSAIYPPADFVANDVNAGLQVYPFQPFNGDIRQEFKRSIFRQLIDPRFQENNVVGARMDSGAYPGADYVLRVRFQDVVVGPPGKERMRFVFVRGTQIAIIDAEAATMQGWQHVLPQFNAFLQTVRIGTGTQPDYGAPAGAGGKALAGLYQGIAQKYMTNLQLGPAYGTYKTALLFYVFSADGRVYRHYDALNVPGNDPARFDYDGAERADPPNSGRYVIAGDSVFIRFGTPQHPKTLVAHVPAAGVVIIEGVSFTRK